MIIIRLPDSRHAITKMMPEELVSALQEILSQKVQALHTSEPHQLRLVLRGRQLDEDIQLQEAGLTNCSLIHLVLPHWGGGKSGKELRAEREPSMKTDSDSSPAESLNFPVDCISQVNEIGAEVEEIAQEQGHYMEHRSEKRKRDQTYDPDVKFEVTQPVSAVLQNIMAKARSNLAAASLETLQVVNLRLQASHAVEDAAVIYLKQMEEKQKATKREMWLQTVHTETLEAILDEWRFKAGLLKQPEQNTTGNTLRNDPDCPWQTSANHKGDHPIVPAQGEMFVMTPTCALSWCEKDAVWNDEHDEYALCCTEEHRMQVEQEAVRWMSQYRIKLAPAITDDRRNVSAEDAACPSQAASNHKGDHPCDKSSERRIRLKEKINAKYRLAQLIITNMRKQKDETRMWRATMKHFICFVDRCLIAQSLRLWCDKSEPMPEL